MSDSPAPTFRRRPPLSAPLVVRVSAQARTALDQEVEATGSSQAEIMRLGLDLYFAVQGERRARLLELARVEGISVADAIDRALALLDDQGEAAS